MDAKGDLGDGGLKMHPFTMKGDYAIKYPEYRCRAGHISERVLELIEVPPGTRRKFCLECLGDHLEALIGVCELVEGDAG